MREAAEVWEQTVRKHHEDTEYQAKMLGGDFGTLFGENSRWIRCERAT